MAKVIRVWGIELSVKINGEYRDCRSNEIQIIIKDDGGVDILGC